MCWSPTRDSLRIYLAGFAMVLTPAHLGEVVKALLLQWRHDSPLKTTVPIVVVERLFDLIAILVIAAAGAIWSGRPLAGALIVVVLAPSLLGLYVAVRWVSESLGSRTTEEGRQEWLTRAAEVAERVFVPRVAAISLALSTLSWLVAASALLVTLRSAGVVIGSADASYAFAYGTAFGAFSLLPAGVGVAGSVMILELQSAEVPAALAGSSDLIVPSVLVVRLFSVWLAVGAGVAMLVVLTRRLTWPDRYLDVSHFEEVAPHYESQIPSHLRQHVLQKKLSPMLDMLADRQGLRGIDLGCGQGWYANELASLTGHDVLGIDSSRAQVSKGAENANLQSATAFVSGDMTELPFRADTLDFAYSVNAFHHIDTMERKRAALAEVARVLKPGGLFFLHEMNVSNPLLRVYLSYVFPLVRSIDEGTEQWLQGSPGPGPDAIGERSLFHVCAGLLAQRPATGGAVDRGAPGIGSTTTLRGALYGCICEK